MTVTDEPAPEGPSEPAAPAPRSRRPLILAVVAILVLAVGGWALFLRDDDDPKSGLPEGSGSAGTIPPAATVPPSEEVASLQALLEKGRALTFHATYAGGGDPAVLGGDLTIEVWRKDGKIRQDTTVVRENNTTRSAGFVLGDDTVTCAKQGDAPWTCSQAEDPGTSPDGVFGSVASQLQGAEVTESKETVADREARCFTFPTGDGTGKMCLTDEGLPLSLSANGQDLTLTDVDETVDEAVFEPPAEP